MADENSFLPGTILAGRYQVRRELGRGGMGVVYLCRDLVADERVALKLLSRPGARVRPEDAWWFQEEARALAGLSHPAIVRARDFGALPDGTPFLAMDAVPGRSMHEWLYLARVNDEPLPWNIVWKTFDHVLGALAHAHARGVIHGDLKPSNVLLDMPPEGEPRVHVLDLGLAWLIQDRIDHRLDGSREAAPTVRWGAGTPGWMAPEQIRFAAPHVGPPTDLYALGCVLFATLAGREVYEGTNDELLQQHRSAPIPEVPLPAGVPSDVGKFVKRLLAKRPWHRFDFAGDARRVWKRFEPRDGTVSVTPLPATLMMSGRIPPSRNELLTPDLSDGPPSSEEPPPSVTTAGLLGLRPSPFVARSAERARLMETVAEVVDSPKPVHRFVLLGGEAGVGKSRLAEWLCEEVHERALMVPLRARYRRIAAPLDGVVGAVTQHYRLERAERDIVEKVLMNAWEVSPDDEVGKTWVAAAAEWIRPTPPGSTAVGPTGKRFRLDRPELRWLVSRKTLERIGRDRPILLWLDDVHYASPATFDALKALHRDSPMLGLLIVATVRSEAVETDEAAAGRVEDILEAFGGERLDVAPFNAQQIHTLLRETLPLDEAAAEAAATRSKGNPLFALQLLHAWAGGGHLQLRAGTYYVPRGALAVQAATTAELWEERLGALPEELRAGARAAAALGGDMRREVLRLFLDALGISSAQTITWLQRAQILLATGDRLRWPHALLQEHLLAQLFQQPDASRVFLAAAEALAHHPAASSRRVVRHRAVSLMRAGAMEAAADVLHGHVAALWRSSRDIAATLRDLAVLDARPPGVPGDWRPALAGARLGTHLRYRAEAMRLAGRLDDARRDAEEARRLFEHAGDQENQAHCLRLLGHIASDLGAEAQGRKLVAKAHSLFEGLGHELGQAQCDVLLGEIDYLLGEHARARGVLVSGAARFAAVGDKLGRAQCLLLQSMVEQAAAGSSPEAVRGLLHAARADFDAIGYRLGLSQCELAQAHAEHRLGDLTEARRLALSARQSFRDLANPRGEAGCERLLAMTALDDGDPALAEEHAEAAARIFDRLADPWGQVEARVLFAQVALDRGDAEIAREHLVTCEGVAVSEAEPRQHRHLTLAWLAYHEGRFHEAAKEIDAARAAFKDSRTGDHTPQLLSRFARMGWPKPAGSRVGAWMRALGRAAEGDTAAETPAAPDVSSS